MAKASVDHIILHTADIDAAVRDFTALGFTVQERNDAGVSHGTQSRFIVFASGIYILLMQFTDPARKKAHRLSRFLETEIGFVDYGVAVPDSEAAEQTARSLGLTPSNAGAHRGVLADGTNWGVRLFTIGRGAPQGHDALPFIVMDTEQRTARVPAYRPHKNGITDLRALHIEAVGAGRVSDILATLTGEKAFSAGPVHSVRLGDCAVTFHERDPQAPQSAGEGGILRIDAVANAAAPDIMGQGARITILANSAKASIHS